jgi:Dyp-type peroxidase family
MEQIDLDDIQGIIARGYGNLTSACYVLLEIRDPASAKRWLGTLTGKITRGDEKPEDSALNVAFTSAGLRKLALPPEVLAMFSNEFNGGMTTPHRQRILGDSGESAPERWTWGGPRTGPIDLLLMIYARDDQELAEVYGTLRDQFSTGGLVEVKTLDTFDIGGTEHFGFKDGISQPFIQELAPSTPGKDENTVKAGEFILGYRNEYGLYTDRPLLKPAEDPQGLLPADVAGSGGRDLGRNGSYLVFRQMRQDVPGFWNVVDRATRSSDGTSDLTARTRVAAKMVGRWPSGAPLLKAPDQDDPTLADDNDFGYHEIDPNGFNCPVGSHIRRANPRDSLDPDPGSARSIAIGKRHMILRRGREYGKPMAEDTASEERGLHFICLNGNIARQFEFIQHTWLNNPKFDGLYDESDPIAGTNTSRGGMFTIQGKPVRRRILDLPQFVAVRGGAYFFLPGVRAIRYLASVGR